MASSAENTVAINFITTNTKKVSELTDAQRREVMEGVFKFGVSLSYNDPVIKIGDLVHGDGVAGINDGFFWMGWATINGVLSLDAHVNFKYQP